MEQAEIRDIINAVILAATLPVSYEKLVELFGTAVDENQIKTALSQLLKTKNGVQKLVKIAEGYQFQIRQEFAPWILKSKNSGEAVKVEKLSRVLMETLAIIAYKQPITRGEIEIIRGTSVHTTIIEELEQRGWIRIVGYTGSTKRATLYGTTKEFLLYFGLNSVHELPIMEK